MSEQTLPNPLLSRLIRQLGGLSTAARLVLPDEKHKARYDLLFQWERRGRVPLAQLPSFAKACAAEGVELSDTDLITLAPDAEPVLALLRSKVPVSARAA